MTNDPNADFGEAYIIEDDGTKTSVPIGFTGSQTAGSSNPYANGPRPAGNPYAGQAGPRVVFTTFPQQPNGIPNQGQLPRGRFKLHLGRRILGLFLMLIGLPMLILPGPGLFCILVGLTFLLAP